jgi:hypothetical protein
MKKNVLLVVILGAALALGMALVGCNANCSSGGLCKGTYGSSSFSTCGDSDCAVQYGKEGPAGTSVYCDC